MTRSARLASMSGSASTGLNVYGSSSSDNNEEAA